MSITIIENHSEIGAGTRGSSLGVDAIKAVAWKQDSKIFSSFPTLKVRNQNKALLQEELPAAAKRIEAIAEVYNDVSGTVKNALTTYQSFPIVLSGDHASAGATIAGIKMAHPEMKLGVVWIDAHADLHTPYTSPSGNVHGMPLAATLGLDNRTKQKNEPTTSEVVHWDRLKNQGGITPKIEPENLVFFGVRDTEKEEEHLMASLGIKNVTVAELRSKGVEASVQEVLNNQLKDCDAIYISFDVDSMDCDKVSYGTGTPVPNGFEVEEANAIIMNLFQSNKVCAFEITEVNPLLDNQGNKMAEAAFEVLQNVVNEIS